MTPCPDTQALRVRFNGERLHAWCLFLDARSPAEREEDGRSGRLKGPVIVFFHGHAQRPRDAFAFTSKLALWCRSGIVVVPVCDTPYGVDEDLRGDRGKETVLMEVVRHALVSRGIPIQGCTTCSGAEVLAEDNHVGEVACPLPAGLIAVGWSHGGILARRFAHSYPE